MTLAPIVPVRLPGLALHLGEPTGKGYRTRCGRQIEGEELEVPMPRFPRSRRHVEAYWTKCWTHEVVCRTCDRIGDD